MGDKRRTHPMDTARTVLTFEYADRIWRSDARRPASSKPIAHRKYALYLAGKMVPNDDAEDEANGVIDSLDKVVPGSAHIFRSLLWRLLKGDRLDPDLMSNALAANDMGGLGSGLRDLAEIARLVIATEIDCHLADFEVVEAQIGSTKRRLFATEIPRVLGGHAGAFEEALRDKIEDWEERLGAMHAIATTLGRRLGADDAPHPIESGCETDPPSTSTTDAGSRTRSRWGFAAPNQFHSVCVTIALAMLGVISDDPFQQTWCLVMILINLACATNRQVFDMRVRVPAR